MPNRLNAPDFMRFPLAIGSAGAALSDRRAHVREQIEQVLFTNPGERWLRPEFGVGVRALVFEPNNQPLWEITKKRLLASLREALVGEVDPASIEVTIETAADPAAADAELRVLIAYRLATINHSERLALSVAGAP